MSRSSFSDEIAVRGSIAGWWAALLTAGIVLMTVKIVRLNEINVYLNAQNVANNRASAKSGAAILAEVKEISKTLNSK